MCTGALQSAEATQQRLLMEMEGQHAAATERLEAAFDKRLRVS